MNHIYVRCILLQNISYKMHTLKNKAIAYT